MAADSAPQSGDRKGYQMDPANALEAVREAKLDADEGADILMVKPALPYLDIIRRVKDATGMPVAAYNVSGEYAMLKAAAERGLLDERAAVLEALTGIRRAGADIVITYHAKDVARWLSSPRQGPLPARRLGRPARRDRQEAPEPDAGLVRPVRAARSRTSRAWPRSARTR